MHYNDRKVIEPKSNSISAKNEVKVPHFEISFKVQALNEGLAQDKIELNKIILLVEQEKNSIHNERSDAEQDKSTLRQVNFLLIESIV